MRNKKLTVGSKIAVDDGQRSEKIDSIELMLQVRDKSLYKSSSTPKIKK